MPVSKRLRYEVLRRDNHACRYCGRTAPGVKLTIDHVLPYTLGGTDEPSNLVTACEECNSGKSSSSPDARLVADVSDDALRWSRAMAAAAEALLNEKHQQRERLQPFVDHWQSWKMTCSRYCPEHRWGGEEHAVELPDNWEFSVANIMATGLPMELVCQAADIAMRARAKDPFAYFCAVAWRRAREAQAIAAALLSTGAVE